MLGDVPLVNHTFDTTRQDAVNDRLKQLHDLILDDVVRNDKSYDIFKRNIKGDHLVETAQTFLVEDQKRRDKLGGPTIKREKFQTNYWNEWNLDKNILEGESAREFAQQQKEDPDLVKLKRRKQAHKRIKEANEAAGREFRTKRVLAHSFDAPGRAGKFELPPIGKVGNVDPNQVFVDYVFHNCLEKDVTETADGIETTHLKSSAVERPKSSKTKSNESFVTKGGALAMAPRHFGEKICTDTAGCDIPPLPSALEKAKEARLINTFGSAPRFPAPSSNNATSSGFTTSSSAEVVPPKSVTNLGHTFGVAPRFSNDDTKGAEKNETTITNAESEAGGDINVPDVKSTPGPGYYTVPRLFDPPANPLAKHETKKLTETYETFDLLYEKQEVMRKVHYGFNCHLHDHVRFGLCGVPGTASGSAVNSLQRSDDDDSQQDADSEQTSRSFGMTLLPSMCHCCHYTHFDTRRMRDPKLVREAKEQIQREIQAEEDAKRAVQEAEDLLLGRHLRQVAVKQENLRKYADYDPTNGNGHEEENDKAKSDPSQSNRIHDEDSVASVSMTSIEPVVSSTSSQSLPTTFSEKASKPSANPLQTRDMTKYYSNRKVKELRDAKIAHAQAIKRVREEDVFLAAVEEAGLIPRPIYELTALMAAALKEDIEAIRIMAQNFMDPNKQQPETRQTALHHAAHANKVRSVIAILRYFHPEYQLKYRKNTTDNIYRFPLQLNLRDHQGDTPLHIACRMGHVEVVEALTADERCRPALPPTTQSQDRLDWLNFIVSGGRSDRGDDSAAENQRNRRGEFETDLCYRYHNRTIGHRMWQGVNAAIVRKKQNLEQQQAKDQTPSDTKATSTTATQTARNEKQRKNTTSLKTNSMLSASKSMSLMTSSTSVGTFTSAQSSSSKSSQK